MEGVSSSTSRRQFKHEPISLVTEEPTQVIQAGESSDTSSEFVDLFSYLRGMDVLFHFLSFWC